MIASIAAMTLSLVAVDAIVQASIDSLCPNGGS